MQGIGHQVPFYIIHRRRKKAQNTRPPEVIKARTNQRGRLFLFSDSPRTSDEGVAVPVGVISVLTPLTSGEKPSAGVSPAMAAPRVVAPTSLEKSPGAQPFPARTWK